MQSLVANSEVVLEKRNPGMALPIPQLCFCSMAASLSPPECVQGVIAMLELISEPQNQILHCGKLLVVCQERFCSLYLNNQANQA